MLDVHSGHPRQEQRSAIAQWQPTGYLGYVAKLKEPSCRFKGFRMDIDIAFRDDTRILIPPVAKGEIINAGIAEIRLFYFLYGCVEFLKVSESFFVTSLPEGSHRIDRRPTAREAEMPLVAVENIGGV